MGKIKCHFSNIYDFIKIKNKYFFNHQTFCYKMLPILPNTQKPLYLCGFRVGKMKSIYLTRILPNLPIFYLIGGGTNHLYELFSFSLLISG